jgi:hypothetical protein
LLVVEVVEWGVAVLAVIVLPLLVNLLVVGQAQNLV